MSSICAARWLCMSLAFAIVAPFANAVMQAGASAAAKAAVAKVSITEQGFSPAVAVVVIGTSVVWTNKGTEPHSLTGQIHSPGVLQPGGSYEREFTTTGEYHYLDGLHNDSTGTVVVIAAGSGDLPPAHGNATHHYGATLTLAVHDAWTYYDSEWDSTTGTCDAQVGSGDRVVNLVVRFPNVTYFRDASAHIEALYADNVRGRFGKTTESIESLISGPDSPLVVCPGGGTFPEATQPADCRRNFTGKPVVLSLAWNPKVTSDTFLITNSGPEITPGSCGSQIVGALVLVGVKKPVLPLNLVGARINYDEAQTNAATKSEVTAMRAGRPFTVSRSVQLDFTTDCCEGFNPGAGGIWARTGNIHSYSASLTIRFTPLAST